MSNENKPQLSMTFHKRSGRYFIRSFNDRVLQFPAEERIHEIWETISPGVSFLVGSDIDNSVVGFWVELGAGTSAANRQKFCDALAEECSPVETPPTFRVVPHSMRHGISIVEILKDGQVCATIYPNGMSGIKITSAHFAGELAQGNDFPEGVQIDNGENVIPPIPAVNITFNPRPYDFGPDGIVRHEG